MSPDPAAAMPALAEARRQIEICNACRYCEGFCAVFPAMTLHRSFPDGEMVQFANLCHACQGCFHACQYTAPHEFDLNIPRVLAELRAESWERFVRPSWLARLVQGRGVAVAALAVVALAAMLAAIAALRPADGTGFYAHLSHAAMVTIFLPAFLAPLAVTGLALRDYWRAVGGAPLRIAHVLAALGDVARLRNLSGGAQGACHYEKGDRPSTARRHAHQAMFWGFVLCFAATSSGTVMHYALDWPAPYGLLTPPKLFGIPGGILMVIGGAWLAALKLRADPALGSPGRWGGEMAVTLLLVLVAASGLALWAATGTGAVASLLALHLGAVLALFLLIPYSKLVHGAFRLAALMRDAQTRGG
jgi:citrate/tricarballylate utilization protein